MPSRRKCAHTTKIERVPRYEVYHGEEDLDERLSSDGTLDLSMKRIKVEPSDGEKSKKDGEEKGEGGDGVDESPRVLSEEVLVNECVEDSASSTGEEPQKYLLGGTSDEADDTSKEDKRSNAHAKSAAAVTVSGTEQQVFIDSNGQAVSAATGLPLFPQATKGKSLRPFKLYTTNRDLLSGLATQGAPSLATYSVPVALTAVPGAVPLAFASLPLVTGAPMIPVTASSSTTSAPSSATAAGAATSCTSSTSLSTANATSKSTSSTTDAHLMTLATEADKILRERHGSGEESSTGMSSDSVEGNTGESENYNTSGDSKDTCVLTGEDGAVLKIPTLSGKSGNDSEGDALSFIQKRAVAAAVAAANPPKNKKKRQALPDQMKDLAYWERRRKNNEAAKRSRDARRAKEDQIAIRAALLEQENIRLKIEVNALKEETAKLRSRLYANNNS